MLLGKLKSMGMGILANSATTSSATGAADIHCTVTTPGDHVHCASCSNSGANSTGATCTNATAPVLSEAA